MVNCSKCGNKIGFFNSVWNGLCKDCNSKEKEKREKERQLKIKAINEIKKYIEHSYTLGENSKEHYIEYSTGSMMIYPYGNTKKEPIIIFNEDDVINLIVKNDYKVKEVIDKIVETELIKIEADKILDRQRKRAIKEQAEKKLYGKIKTRRKILTEEEKEMVFDKFNNECAVCGKKEGLHIHHKDENSSNNQMINLVVLCGV